MSEQGRGPNQVPPSDEAPARPPGEPAPRRKPRRTPRQWLMFVLRWGIAVFGIWWVISQITWRDRVLVLDPQENRPVERRLADMPPMSARQFRLYPDNVIVRRDVLVHKADQKKVQLELSGGGTAKVDLLALDLSDDLRQVQRLLVVGPDATRPVWVAPADVVGYRLKVPHPLVEVGVGRMLRGAATGNKPWLLVLSIFIFPITFIVTSIRWYWLLRVVDIYLTPSRAFVLNMVGAFYNTFMPGSTGGDVLKAWYASRHTIHRTRAVMSVFVDRVIGLLALVVMGGAMAAYQYFASPFDPAGHALGQIAVISALIVICSFGGAIVLTSPTLKRVTGLGWLIVRLPKQKQVQNAIVTLELYRRRKGVVIAALVGTLPVHVTVVISAILACMAFGLTIPTLYYFVAVPVIVLVGSIPISPQGAGVMEYFAILLVSRQGGTVSQAFALTMSIRMVQILWNLTGGIFVFRGGYHQPGEDEAAELETDGAENGHNPGNESPTNTNAPMTHDQTVPMGR